MKAEPYAVPQKCPQGSFYARTKGYVKVPEDVCVGGHEDRYLPDHIACPVK